jgi:general secretion pathway protein F
MLLRGGYTLSDALPLAQDVAWTETLSAGVVAASRAVAEGKRVSVAFAGNGLTDQVSERLLQVGERSGHLAKVMDIIASGHRQEFILAVERATRLIEPILLMVMGALVGAIIILMYAPVFELAGAM